MPFATPERLGSPGRLRLPLLPVCIQEFVAAARGEIVAAAVENPPPGFNIRQRRRRRRRSNLKSWLQLQNSIRL